MRIWIIDHYTVPEKFYPLIRQTLFAKNFIEQGHDVRIFSASTVHKSSINLIESNEKFKEEVVENVTYTYVRCHGYQGNGIKRIYNMIEFAAKLPKVCEYYASKEGKPDVIIACSMTLQACKQGIKIARKLGSKVIAQITDLWPETIVSYSGIGTYNPVIVYLRCIEKWIYRNSDKIVFSMEGAYDYIREQRWEKVVPREKVCCINNGIDLERFNINRREYSVMDSELENEKLFKVIYTGAINRVNNLGLLLDVAKMLIDKNIVFLIWGDGDELKALMERVNIERIRNVFFKGRVEKKYIPYITSRADINIAHNSASDILRFGVSFNKIFDYLAAGKPILVDFPCKYNPVLDNGAGLGAKRQDAAEIAEIIVKMSTLTHEEYKNYCDNAKKTATKYDFNVLANRMLKIIQSL